MTRPFSPDFAKWERTTKDLIALRFAYVDILEGDHVAAIFLAQCIYWHKEGKGGRTRLRASRDGRAWWVRTYEQLHTELRIPQRTMQSKMQKLKDMGLIEVRIMKFSGFPKLHISLNKDELESRWRAITQKTIDDDYEE